MGLGPNPKKSPRIAESKFGYLKVCTVWSSDLYTLLMRYGVKFTSYRIKSVYKSLDQTVVQ